MAKTAEILEIPATITDRGQTTVPAAIRRMLALGKRDQVVFRGLADGTVVIAKKQARTDEDDPVIGKFLEFLPVTWRTSPRGSAGAEVAGRARQGPRQGRQGRSRGGPPGRRGVSDEILKINGWTIYAHRFSSNSSRR